MTIRSLVHTGRVRVSSVTMAGALIAAIAILGITAGCGDASAQAGASTSVTLSLIGTSDFHGALVAHDGRGGIARFAGYVRNIRETRARDGGAVMLVDAGDMFQGTLESNMTEGATVMFDSSV